VRLTRIEFSRQGGPTRTRTQAIWRPHGPNPKRRKAGPRPPCAIDHAPDSLPTRLRESHFAGLYSGNALVAVLRGSTASVMVLPITKCERHGGRRSFGLLITQKYKWGGKMQCTIEMGGDEGTFLPPDWGSGVGVED
jgi:hypothetical protein